MMENAKPRVVIIDYHMGNLFSIKHACEAVGLNAVVTSDKNEILSSDAVILPGVGAFGNAMSMLKKLDLITVIHDLVDSNKFIIGICLGAQLLFSESHEFGLHQGLGIIKGTVQPFKSVVYESRKLKVPHVGWNQIFMNTQQKWEETLLDQGFDETFMYFVHSYYIVPEQGDVILTRSHYGPTEFCSSIQYKNIFGYQFHPERSGKNGLKLYRNLAKILTSRKMGMNLKSTDNILL